MPIMFEITENSAKNVIIENKTIVPWREFKKTESVKTGPVDFKTEKTTRKVSFFYGARSLKEAFTNVKLKGYGVVTPAKEDIRLEEPVIIKQGSKFGVKIRSEAPSIHMIRANIETEIAPIVGSEKQAEDLAEYIKKESETPEGVWGTNIFGKSVEELVMDGMKNKISMINDESQVKLQDSMQKIVNDSKGGMICIII